MKTIQKIALFLLVAGMLVIAGCNRNYYSGTGKGSNCGCPSHKGMSGY
jgi:predicted small secreted protein